MQSDFCGGAPASVALRSFDPRIWGWHPGSVSCAGESECHSAGASPLPLLPGLSLPPIRGHLPPPSPYPPSLALSGSWALSSSYILHLTKEGHCQQHRVCLVMIFSMFYDLDGPEKVKGSARVVCRLFVRSPTPSHSTCPPRPGNYAGMCPSVHLVSTQTPPNTVQLSAQQKMGGPTLPASTGTL